MNTFSLRGKTILITGASSGIGAGCCILLSRQGADIILVGRDTARLSGVLKELEPGDHSVLSIDLADIEDIETELLPVLEKYKKITGSKIKVISQVAPNMDNNDYFAEINRAMDHGADILQIQGNHCDWLVKGNKIDVIQKMMDKIRSQRYTAGLAAHSIESIIACEENGIIPDYYMKTMHHDQYWSAHPREYRFPFEVDGKEYLDHNRFHNNMFCLFPERTVEFVNKAKVPVMGYKVLAAGAIEPKDGFKWAFENGADFICVGMFDFQIVRDVNICMETLSNLNNRKREWYG